MGLRMETGKGAKLAKMMVLTKIIRMGLTMILKITVIRMTTMQVKKVVTVPRNLKSSTRNNYSQHTLPFSS